MATPKAIVLRAAGTNCDRETEYALELAGFEAQRVHVFRLMENPAALAEYQFLVIPGGFSYGDDVAAGKILANQMLHRLADALNAFVAAEKLVLGICNGFQVMIKSGLLPWGTVDTHSAHRDATRPGRLLRSTGPGPAQSDPRRAPIGCRARRIPGRRRTGC